jgi:PhoPQ-activated pathogenicity-related protein
MHFSRIVLAIVSCSVVLNSTLADAAAPPRTALDDYVQKKDPAFAWRLVSTQQEKGLTTYVLEVTSQTWRTTKDLDRPLWKHWVVIARPEGAKSNSALLLIGGGRNGRPAPDKADDRTRQLALGTNSVVATVGMTPNQPLSFVDGDNKPRVEDDLIAFCWNKFLQTEDPTWLPRLPMVTGAVRAMDAIVECLGGLDQRPMKIKHFVVAGGSKRGWTTWLTGAVDPRVVAVIPIVIDVVNVKVSMTHHYEAYGFWAPAVGDYEHHKIMDQQESPAYAKLLALVDPYAYRHRLKMPKYMVNSSGDQFFLPDSSQFYFDDLLGEKYLRYVPNSDHGLGDTDALESIGAFYLSILAGQERPKFSWKADREAGSLFVKTMDRPKAVKLWQATNPEARDFRLETIGKAWTSAPLSPSRGGVYLGRVSEPEEGWTAFFVELTYDSGGRFPFKFTTEVVVVPDVLPFKGKLETTAKAGAAN